MRDSRRYWSSPCNPNRAGISTRTRTGAPFTRAGAKRFPLTTVIAAWSSRGCIDDRETVTLEGVPSASTMKRATISPSMPLSMNSLG